MSNNTFDDDNLKQNTSHSLLPNPSKLCFLESVNIKPQIMHKNQLGEEMQSRVLCKALSIFFLIHSVSTHIFYVPTTSLLIIIEP